MHKLSGIAFVLLIGFGGNDARAQAAATPPSDATSAPASDGSGWYLVRRDTRKCASPACGGWFVKLANLPRTICGDGHAHEECYVAALDWSATGLSDAERDKLANSPVVLRGRLAALKDAARHQLSDLEVSEVWAPAVPRQADGGYLAITGALYRARDNGVRCFTWPCPTTTQEKLNTSSVRTVAGVDLSSSGANDKQLDEAYQALVSPDGLLVDGSDEPVTGPGGTLPQLVAANFALRVEPAAPAPQACGGPAHLECDAGDYCDATVAAACGAPDLPGVCKPVSEMCMQRWAPVCGCDGKTYSNDCFRVMARVQLDHDGECAQ